METFYTIQGEGMNVGRAAYFIRLAGCDVGCTWCDVKESWDAQLHPEQTLAQLIEEVEDAAAELVVVTGGEPTLHNLEGLTAMLKARGVETSIETAGTGKLTGQWDWVCLSPKRFKLPLEENFPLAHELKVVIGNLGDFKWAEKCAERVADTCALLLQPEWESEEEMLPHIIRFVQDNPRWRISLQTHKYMGIP